MMASHLTIHNNLLTEATFRNIFNKGTLQDKCMVYTLQGCIYLAERTNTCLLFSSDPAKENSEKTSSVL